MMEKLVVGFGSLGISRQWGSGGSETEIIEGKSGWVYVLMIAACVGRGVLHHYF